MNNKDNNVTIWCIECGTAQTMLKEAWESWYKEIKGPYRHCINCSSYKSFTINKNELINYMTKERDRLNRALDRINNKN